MNTSQENYNFEKLIEIYIDAFNHTAGFNRWNKAEAAVLLRSLLSVGTIHILGSATEMRGFAITTRVKDSPNASDISEDWVSKKALYLSKVAIGSSFRGTGACPNLIDQIAKTAKNKNEETLVMRVRATNISMKKVALKTHFRLVGEFESQDPKEGIIIWEIYKRDL